MLQAIIDRFEGNKAVVLVGEAESKVIFPKKYLPIGVKEGDCLYLAIDYDEEATQAAKREAARLLAAVQSQNK